MSDKTLSNTELELTQKIQMHFPRDVDPEIIKAWNGAKKEVIVSAIADVFGKMPQKSSILKFTGIVNISATTEKFVARDRFVIDTSDGALAKIWDLGDRFQEEFLDKIEEPIDKTSLQYHKLVKNSVDDRIIAELGGEGKIEVTLAEMFSLMKNQGNGEKGGTLIANGYASIFYIRNTVGVLRAVYCDWYDDGWYVYADSVDDPYDWHAGDQVFSHSSLES